MRPSFKLRPDHTLESVILKRTEAHDLQVGTNVILMKDYTNEYGTIPAGSQGFVSFIDDEDGLHEVLMEGIVPALLHWENKLFLLPYHTDDLTDCLVAALRHIPPAARPAFVAQLRTG